MNFLDELADATNLPPLTNGELEQLILDSLPLQRTLVARLCREVKVLRDEAGERERMAALEPFT